MSAKLLREFEGPFGPAYLDPTKIVLIESMTYDGEPGCRVWCDYGTEHTTTAYLHVTMLAEPAHKVREAWLDAVIDTRAHAEEAELERARRATRRRHAQLRQYAYVFAAFQRVIHSLIGNEPEPPPASGAGTTEPPPAA